uniref:Uncharacterized protein n=1 Tax=Triticum urartu TaxID=4572 RepID=A0A8R7TL69_TRIUA
MWLDTTSSLLVLALFESLLDSSLCWKSTQSSYPCDCPSSLLDHPSSKTISSFKENFVNHETWSSELGPSWNFVMVHYNNLKSDRT